MLPRITTTHSFDTKFWFNGSATDYWPTKLTDEHIGGPNCLKRNGANCVSEGFKLFEGYYTYARNQVDYQVQTEEPLNPRIIQAYLRGSGSAETWSLAPHAPTSFLANEMWNDPHWYPRTTHATGQRSMHIDAQMSVVRTVCTRQFQEFPNTTIELSLPMLAEYTTWATEDSQGPYTNVRLPKPLWSLNTASLVNDSNIAVAWIPTTANLTSMTTGIVILGALNSTHSTKRLGLTCSIDARWNNASHTVTETTTYLRQVEKQGNPVNATLGGSCPIDTLHKAALPVDHRYWRTITAESSFLEALNAKPNPKSSKADTTSITSVLQAANMDPSKAFKPAQPQLSASIKRYETVIATVFADAISRIGLEKVSPHESATIFTSSPEADCHFITKYSRLRFCPKPPTGSYTPLTMKAFLKGYAFEASRVTDYLAIGVMIIYTSLALAHIVCLLAFRRTCACWDTIEEVIALALTSKARGKGIGEMAVGVRRTETMGLMARVRRVKVGDEELGTEAGKVQLLLDDRGADAQVEVKKHVDHGNSGNKGATKGSRDREIAQQKNRRAMSYPTPPTKFIESSTANGRNSC
ncbi:uncharacterized protein KY384_008183 [Bacidia gigantensis]|uniref:uncharacterized protein n=1 Tax=Bacidia gigantensis TaxID=2732470 RepID=UPI001D03AA00|nr:uncharacterized protein KY384_008183 [Bacidia gigantensis]KAG8526754.1 hypothetical protein KY384_008183 [Bacidia gigantensis]